MRLQNRFGRIWLAVFLGLMGLWAMVGWGIPLQAGMNAAQSGAIISHKTVSPGLVGPGETVTYTIVLSNSSAVSDVNALLNDPLPTGLTYVAGSARTQPANSGHLTPTAHAIAWSGVVANGQVISLSFKAKVDASLSQDVILTNTATLSQVGGLLTLTAPVQIDAQMPSALIWSPQAGQVVTAEHLQVMGYAWDGDERPSFPADPLLTAIQNNGFGYYNVTWSQADLATSYVLQEASSVVFSSPKDRYAGPNTQVFVQAQPAGVYYYRVMAINLHGNSRWSNVVSATVNTLAVPERGRWDGNPQLQQASSLLSGVWVQIDNSPWLLASGLSPWTYSFQLSQQDYTLHTLQAYSRDEVGHTSLTDTIAFYVDRQSPVVTLNNLQAGQIISSASVQIQGSVGAEAGPGQMQVALSLDDGQSWQAVNLNGTNWSYQWTPDAADGVYTVTTRSIDGSGNVRVSDGLTVTVDRQLPVALVGNMTAGQGISLSTYLITGTASDQTTGVALVEVSINAGGWQMASRQAASGQTDWSYPWTPGAGGDYSLRVRAVDGAGNVGASDEVTATVDRSKPQVTMVSPAANAWISTTQHAITGTASDNLAVARVEVRINTGNWQTASGQTAWSYQWTPGANGNYTLWARAIDQVGNITQTAGLTVGVDSTPPQVSIVSLTPNQQINVNSTVAITGTASDGQSGLARVDVSTDGGATWQAASGTTAWSYNWKASPPGEKQIYARALDAAGNLTATAPVTIVVNSFHVYLPLMPKRWPPLPYAPVLAAINNPEQDERYTMIWSYPYASPPALTYTLQESKSSGFETFKVYYPSHSISHTLDGQLPGIYYYRLRGHNAYGPGAWSNVVSTTVRPGTPAINPISNSGQQPNYVVSWSVGRGAATYVLQEARTAYFTDTTQVYSGAALSTTLSGQASGSYYYRVRSVYETLSSAWSNVVSTSVTSLHDDFNDPNSGWEMRRTSSPYITETTVSYVNGRLVTGLYDRFDFSIISPMRQAPQPPYTISLFTHILHSANQNSYGIVFGGNGGDFCTVVRSNSGDSDGCFYHYYRLNVVWSGDYLQAQVKRIDYHEGEKGKGIGEAELLPYTWLHGMTEHDGWNLWEIHVKENGFSVYVNDQRLLQTNDATFVNEPYYGIFTATGEFNAAEFEHEYFYVDAVASTRTARLLGQRER